MLGVAFDIPDADKAEEYADRIEQEGADRWAVDTTLKSLQESAAHVSDATVKGRLMNALSRLNALCAN
jgi:hypothetical protein